MDDARVRFMRDRVMTATPAQRVVMLFDRLTLDLHRATESTDPAEAGVHLGHASTIVAELIGSLDMSAGGPADNLASIYGFLLKELTAARLDAGRDRIAPLHEIVTGLRDAFATAAATVAATAAVGASAALTAATAGAPVPARAWVG